MQVLTGRLASLAGWPKGDEAQKDDLNGGPGPGATAGLPWEDRPWRSPAPAREAADPSEPDAPQPPAAARIDIATRHPSPDADAMDALVRHGIHLARQDAWDLLSTTMLRADTARDHTPGRKPKAAFLARGARQDAMSTLTPRIQKNDRRAERPVLAMLDAQRDDDPDCPALAYVVAAAHIEVAEMWRAGLPLAEVEPRRREACMRNLHAAATLADQFDPFELNSPLWALVRCRVLPADPDPMSRVIDDFEDLIELDPRCPDYMTALGLALTPQAFGSIALIERAARASAERTADHWGKGAYAWTWIGAIETDSRLAQHVDPVHFNAALRDILHHAPDQHTVNRLAAFATLSLPDAADPDTTAHLADGLDWIAAEHLAEVHPLIWAEAPLARSTGLRPTMSNAAVPAPGLNDTFDDRDDAPSPTQTGRARAIAALGARFGEQLARDGRLVFGPGGLQDPSSAAKD